MAVHVWDVLGVSYEGALTEVAFVGLGGAAEVRPAVKFEVPLSGEALVAYYAVVGPLAAVRLQMGVQFRS